MVGTFGKIFLNAKQIYTKSIIFSLDKSFSLALSRTIQISLKPNYSNLTSSHKWKNVRQNNPKAALICKTTLNVKTNESTRRDY